MRNFFTTAALAALLAACGGVDDSADEPSVLARVQGVVSNPQNLQVAGDLHLALVWYAKTPTFSDWLSLRDRPIFIVSEDLPLTTSFPANFTFSLTNPPPPEAVDSVIGVPPDEAKGEAPWWHEVDARVADAVLVLYNDRNHNGRLDLVDFDAEGKGEFIDEVVGMARRLLVTWFDGPLPPELVYPEANGQPAAGFNLSIASQDVIQVAATGSGTTFDWSRVGKDGTFTWQTLDTPITIELSDDPALDLVMCRKNSSGCMSKISQAIKD